jgi:release factor glutamine methyltransferase
MRDFEQQREYARRLVPVAKEDAFTEAGFLLDYCKAHPSADAEQLIARRLMEEPLQYVLGEWEFFGLPFRVDHRALIPRPDTELLCEIGLSLLNGGERVLDLCCGSGCIGIALAKHRHVELVAADISEDALALTKENAERNNVTIRTRCSDLFDQVEGTFDLIVSNPPYLTATELKEMDCSLRFEPVLALDGGLDGLMFYRRIRDSYQKHLKKGGTLLLEIGATQKDAVCALFPGSECSLDYGSRPRVVVVKND